MEFMPGFSVIDAAAPVTFASRASRVLTPEFMVWGSVLGGALILLGVAAMILRRFVLSSPTRTKTHDVLDSVHQLHEDGLLSDEEYRRARRKALDLPPPEEAGEDEKEPEADAAET